MASDNVTDKATEWSNEAIAERFDKIAELLEAQDANPYRVRAYRMGAATLRDLERPAVSIYAEEGMKGLQALPYIGESLARIYNRVVFEPIPKRRDQELAFYWEVDFPYGG